jgi:osmoprotectant transport system substrate-binding protein
VADDGMPRSAKSLLRSLLLVLTTLASLGPGLAACGTSTSPDAASKSIGSASAATTPALPGTGKPMVTIGDKNFTEQFVLGELYSQALAAQGYSTLINRNIGPTEVTIQALQSGRLSMYPEYLGTWLSTVAGDQRTFPTERSAYRAGRAYALAHGLDLLRPTPFGDVDGIGVTAAYAKQNGLRGIGDLAPIASMLTLGAPPQFKTEAMGLSGLGQTYGVYPATFKPLEIGEQYQRLSDGSVQAADVMATDPQLLGGQYALLGDPKRLFGWSNVVPVVPAKVLLAEGPAFSSTINAVSALLTLPTMRTLNADVDVYHQDPLAVAKLFLQAHGLVPPSS